MGPNELSEDLKSKARACETAEEMLELARQEGVELSDEQLDSISGGAWCNTACSRNRS